MKNKITLTFVIFTIVIVEDAFVSEGQGLVTALGRRRTNRVIVEGARFYAAVGQRLSVHDEGTGGHQSCK